MKPILPAGYNMQHPAIDPRTDDVNFPVQDRNGILSRGHYTVEQDPTDGPGDRWDYVWAVNNFVIDHPATIGNPVVRESLLPWQVNNLMNGGNANDFPPAGWTQTAQGVWIAPAKKPIGTLLADLDSAIASLKASLLT